MASDSATCRSCGATLVRSAHIRFQKLDDHVEAFNDARGRRFSMGADYGWRQNPCPHCNEPEPIKSGWIGIAFGLFILAFFAAIVGAFFLLPPS